MKYLCFDTAINDNFTLLLLQKEYPLQQCLFQDTKDAGIWDVAPWIFEVDDNVYERLIHPLASLQHIIFFESVETIDSLRQHLQYFIYKKSKNKEYFFRFWDARVIVKYLEGCSHKELETFFGDTIDTISVESQNNNELLKLSINKKNKLEKKLVARKTFFPGSSSIKREEHKDPFAGNTDEEKKQKNAEGGNTGRRKFLMD